MTYNVFGGMLNLAQSKLTVTELNYHYHLSQLILHCYFIIHHRNNYYCYFISRTNFYCTEIECYCDINLEFII